MPQKQRKVGEIKQSTRFIEAARAAEVDESGKKFERAFRKIAPKRRARKRRIAT